ncbi:MAG: hypothetical protein JO372_17280 [Solirubrobacterales bacterium]|nr:hypothetical protein [Solirubrobacterales bacterium]
MLAWLRERALISGRLDTEDLAVLQMTSESAEALPIVTAAAGGRQNPTAGLGVATALGARAQIRYP